MMFQKILVALDQSEISKQVFKTALFLAHATEGQLLLTQVLSLSHTPLPVLHEGLYPSSLEAMGLYVEQVKLVKTRGLQLLQRCCDLAANQGIDTQYIQPFGEPGREICKLADSWGATLVIIGRQNIVGGGASDYNQAPFPDRALGSVCNYVLHHAPTAVLMV